MSTQRHFKFILRKRIKLFSGVVLILSCIYIFYQLFYFRQLNEHLTPHNLIRGTHMKQAMFYIPNEMNQFVCIHSKETIDFLAINDDYCDCLDGSDEPGTNACSNGIYFCAYQDRSGRYHNFIPSTMVNDGICDCCDGSDEWGSDPLPFGIDGSLLGYSGGSCLRFTALYALLVKRHISSSQPKPFR